jgi:hypothetical protein
VGAITQEKFRVLPSRGENPRCGLNWLCLAMALFKALFLGATTFIQGENLRSMIERRRRLCAVFFLEASFFGELALLVLSRWC